MAKGVTVLNSGPLKVKRGETTGKGMAILAGGEVKVKSIEAAGAVRLAGVPGPPGPPGDQLDPNFALDGGNF